MSKPHSKAPVAPRGPDREVSHLDEKISQLSVKAVKSIQRFRVTILSLIGVAVAAVFGVVGFREYDLSRRRAIAARLEAFLSPAAGSQSPDVDALLPELMKLVDEVQGTDAEKWVVKPIVRLLIDEARREIFPDQTAALGIDGETPAVEPVGGSPTLLLDKAEQFVAATRDRFPRDADIQHWATESLRAIASLRDRPEPGADRSQKPIVPPAPVPGGAPADAEAGPPPPGDAPTGVEGPPEPAPPTGEGSSGASGTGGDDDGDGADDAVDDAVDDGGDDGAREPSPPAVESGDGAAGSTGER